ncbi:hypothetical protein [Marinobacter sp.]|uniref:hypothetical protein n=1 Tax=Marinobacter sp. TaxID=50741 RepID=UPI0035656977
MLRFPNPGSDLDNIVQCFMFLYENIERSEYFSIHDMQELLVPNGLISSSGAVGTEALLKGSNKDLSRDKSYNQCKMYAEIYRMLGWFQSGKKALIYNFTLLGDHIAHATTNQKVLIGYCFLGISYPNEVLSVNGQHHLRPFLTILKAMSALDGVLSRDEMILGPLSMSNDTCEEEFREMCSQLRSLRKSQTRFRSELNDTLAHRRITKTTAGNYTRFPLGALRWLRWAEPESNKKDYEKTTHTYRITEEGTDILTNMLSRKDVRIIDFLGLPDPAQKEFSITSFYRMLFESGFDISDNKIEVSRPCAVERRFFDDRMTVFSPFQVLSSKKLYEIFGNERPHSHRKSVYSPEKIDDAEFVQNLNNKIEFKNRSLKDFDNKLSRTISSILEENSRIDIDSIVGDLANSFISYSKDDFYPLVAELFSIVGLKCEVSPHGVNSRRWDAIILSDGDSIPIEIKSPAEEINVSVKAVRQALENKIILQSRQSENNEPDTSSMVVGFYLPNERAEVAQLVEDIYKVYGISIAVFGIKSLLTMAIRCIKEDKSVDFSEFTCKRGLIDV